MKFCLASNNKGKIKEFKDILEPLGYELETLADIGFTEDIEENGTTFYENALIKAKAVSKFTNNPVIADDSGICVDHLDGRPGIYSHRFGNVDSDEARNEYLLELSKNVSNRKAHFTCDIVLLYNDNIWSFEGICEGTLAYESKGNSGFGYDYILIPDGYDKTMAELGMDIKNQISHRARAIFKLKECLINDFTN